MMRTLKAFVRRRPSLFRIGRWAQLLSPVSNIEPEISLLPYLVRSESVAIDVGAHSGVYTYALSRLARHVIAIEPNPSLAQDLAHVFPRQRVTVVAGAASDVRENALLRTPVTHRGGAGLATLAPTNTLGGDAYNTITVAANPLDQIAEGFSPVGFIKIDVEGHELAVLQGARQTLDQWRPNLLIEAEERHRARALESVVEFLRPWGYHGFFLRDRVLTSITRSDALRDQDPGTASTRAGQEHRSHYPNNFIFIAEEGPLDGHRSRDKPECNQS